MRERLRELENIRAFNSLNEILLDGGRQKAPEMGPFNSLNEIPIYIYAPNASNCFLSILLTRFKAEMEKEEAAKIRAFNSLNEILS